VLTDASAVQSLEKWVANNKAKILNFKKSFGVSENALKNFLDAVFGLRGGASSTYPLTLRVYT
jgi:hypothetical protein